jgi:hypothetical protein
MFGKPSWFVPKSFGWGLHPVTWQGWAYTFAWVGVIAVPFVVLLTRESQGGGLKVFEASIWLMATISALFYDVYLILGQIRGGKKSTTPATSPAAKPVDDALYIGDDTEPVATRHFQLRRKA